MLSDRDLLHILKTELAFLEKGGYHRGARYPWRPKFVFEDSPTCINFEELGEPRPCTECPLIRFVPRDHLQTRSPCRHIHLTSSGETVHSFYEWGTEEELEAALREWLQRTIEDLDIENRVLAKTA